MEKDKIGLNPDEYWKLMELWDEACRSEGKDPKLEGALYIFDESNPAYRAYKRYEAELRQKYQ